MIAVAVGLLVVLGIIGSGVESKLKPTNLTISGTESERAGQLLDSHFGDSAPFAILLRGPEAELNRQGPELIRALRRDPRVSTLSPWDRGSLQRLRPGPGKALVLADFHVGVDKAVNDVVPRLERTLTEATHPPVTAITAGYATLSRAIQEKSIDASEKGELIALPVLLIVLLLVFRSPIAAAVPLGFGVSTVFASRGLLHFGAQWFSVDAFALTVCTMMGLALGVDYALLMVSRFREELAAGAEPLEAAWATKRHAGRTVAFAGSTLLLSMIVALFIVPGSLLASLAGTVAMVVVLSVTAATVVGPALLLVLGKNIERWRIGAAPGEGRSRLMVFVSAALRRPAPVAALIGGIVLLLAAPALALKTSAPSPEELPKSDKARADFETIAKTIGPGWEAPFQIIAATNGGPITGAKDLAALTGFQRRLADLHGIQAVIGPAQATEPVKPVQELGNAFLSSDGNIPAVKQLVRLGHGLDTAADGVGQLRGGLSEASSGAELLATGSGRAGKGAELIAAGLGRAAAGSARAINALDKFAKGSKRLANAQQLALTGLLQLRLSGIQSLGGANVKVNGLRPARKVQRTLENEVNTTLPKLIGPAKAADEQLKVALAQIQGMTIGKGDPNYEAALNAVRQASGAISGTDPVSGAPYAAEYAGMVAELEAMKVRLAEQAANAKRTADWEASTYTNVNKIVRSAKRLENGMRRIKQGGQKLASGAGRLAKAASSLGSGIGKLQNGATALVGGIARLTGGTEALQVALSEGFQRSAPLESGLQEAGVQVLTSHERLERQARKLSRGSPNLFNSGYFVLSALDGAPPKVREGAATTIDLDGGGQAASILAISHYAFNTPGSTALNRRLNEMTSDFAKESGLQAGVAGGAAELNDYSHVTHEKIPIIVAAITFATFLVLALILRALPLAALAVGLNLATVAVAFGVLTALSYLPEDWPLGGHEHVNAVGAVMIFGIVFGLSIDYAVFLLVRMREHYEEHGDNAKAIEFGLDKTARVITGAAAIMMAVFIAFAGAPIATVSQLGVGLTIAVLLDATVVRIVLLPALMLLVGNRVWWFPKMLQRVVPRISV